jgi:hypothetical protein
MTDDHPPLTVGWLTDFIDRHAIDPTATLHFETSDGHEIEVVAAVTVTAAISSDGVTTLTFTEG